MGTVKITKIKHLGWDNCVKIANGIVELIVTTDVGPRIIHYGFIGGTNHMKVFDDQAGKTNADEWMSYGGHRLWHSPEEMPRTYDEDNVPCEWKKIENGIWTRSAMDQWTQVEKELEIILDPLTSKVTINHRITNLNAWDIELAVWCLTVMAPGGLEIIPQITDGPKLLPNRSIALWTYTKMNDPRVQWLDKYIFISQDTKAKTPFKIGLPVPAGWVGYANFGELFVKRFDYIEDALYPDFGYCSYETYTNADMIELETLSPLWQIGPSDAIEHLEVWELYQDVNRPVSESDVDKNILPILSGKARKKPAKSTASAKPKGEDAKAKKADK